MTTLPALKEQTVVSRLEAASALLQDADIALAKELKAVGKAAEEYAKSKNLGEEIQQRARAVTLQSERKLGELLAVTPKNAGARGVGKSGVPFENPTLKDLGVDKKESSAAQQLAALPQAKFDEVLAGKPVRKALSEARVEKQSHNPKAVKPTPPAKSAKSKAPASDEQKYVTHIAELEEKLTEAAEEIERLSAVEQGDEAELIQRLQIELRSVKAKRDSLMRENVELRRQVKYLERAKAAA